MLDSITLLCAVGEIGEESVLDTIRVLHLLDDQPQQRHRNRKMWRIVLIAAINTMRLPICKGRTQKFFVILGPPSQPEDRVQVALGYWHRQGRKLRPADGESTKRLRQQKTWLHILA